MTTARCRPILRRPTSSWSAISRTSKTPTSIYLANRGIKTANIPLVPGIPPPSLLGAVKKPLVVGLVASPERIVQIRQNRLLTLNAPEDSPYVDKTAVAEEVAYRASSAHATTGR